MDDLVIFDIDGTLANHAWRKNHLPDYDAYHEGISADLPIQATVRLARLLHESGVEVKLWTGRPDIHRMITIGWLAYHRIPFSTLWMRQPKDLRHDWQIKSDWLTDLTHPPIMIFEDRNSVVKMVRDRGIICFQVAEGDF
jgi:hypothetical protein